MRAVARRGLRASRLPRAASWAGLGALGPVSRLLISFLPTGGLPLRMRMLTLEAMQGELDGHLHSYQPSRVRLAQYSQTEERVLPGFAAKFTCPSALCHGPIPKSLTSSNAHAFLLQNSLFSQRLQGQVLQAMRISPGGSGNAHGVAQGRWLVVLKGVQAPATERR